MSTLKPSYGTSTAITMTLASLATDANLVAGRESNSVDNTSDLADDCHVGGKVTLGTSPTAARVIEIWAIGSYDGTTFGAGATGSDANFTPQASGKNGMVLLTLISTTNTSNQQYNWGPCSIAQAFGGAVPKKWSVYIVHNTGVNLNATAGNHEVKYTPIQYTNV